MGGKMFLFCASSAHNPCIQIIEKTGNSGIGSSPLYKLQPHLDRLRVELDG